MKKNYRKYETRVCEECGKEYTVRKDQQNKFCGYECYWNSLRKPKTKTCPVCGTVFNVKKSESYCSKECLEKHRIIKNWLTLKCDQCGKEFIRKKSRPIGKTSFCSKKCRDEFLRGSILIDGENKTKANICQNYKNIGIGEGKIMSEHRVVMESHIGRKLHSYEIVHHIDGNKRNNDISNLMIMTRSEHMKYHRGIRYEQLSNSELKGEG